jgi:DNA-binding NtrC family response regulator
MLVGQSPQILKIKRMIRECAKTDDNVLIIGEVGTGKKLVAQEIHQRSKQKNKSFVTVNCTAIGDTITEMDLFGEVKEGSHSIERKIGLFEQAKKGTLYLENFDELMSDYQQKLFNILHEKRVKKAGDNEFSDVTFRIIATTTDKDITKLDSMRKDLLSLISKFTIHIPPLKERKQDIPSLFTSFLEQYCDEYNHEIPPVPADLFESLMEYEWSANVEELKNATRNLVLMSPEGQLSMQYLPFEYKKHPFEFLEGRELPDAMMEVERYLIKKALRRFAGNQTKASHALNVSEAALRYKMKKYDLSRKTF